MTLLPSIIDDSISSNIYSKQLIYKTNLQTLYNVIKSASFFQQSWYFRYYTRSLYVEQLKKFRVNEKRIEDLENRSFRFGMPLL